MHKKKIINLILSAVFCFSNICQGSLCAQEMPFMPDAGIIMHTSQAFVPVSLVGLKIFKDNPFHYNFIIDSGDSREQESVLKKDSLDLIKYFMASLTIPAKDQWVNLSAFEPGRIIDNEFGYTQAGCDLLAQDYLLKQLTASLIYPENDLGKSFWDKVYKKAFEKFGTTDIPIDTFNKVWIVPDKAVVYENEDPLTNPGQVMAFVAESHLKVMTEDDYSAQKNVNNLNPGKSSHDPMAADILKQIIIPEIEKEVNYGKNFSTLRQIYQSVILATWFKRNLKNSILGNKYVDQNKITGIDLSDNKEKDEIYNKYIKAFKEGAYNYIKEDYDPFSQDVVAHKYVSGGVNIGIDTDSAMTEKEVTRDELFYDVISKAASLYSVEVNFDLPSNIERDNKPDHKDFALISGAEIPESSKYTVIKSGEEAVFTLVVDPKKAPQISLKNLKLAINMSGEWQVYDGAMELAGLDDNGNQVFVARAKIETNRNRLINYTFFIEDEKTKERQWVNSPGDDGSIYVKAPFRGRLATISMELGGKLGQKAGGQGDVVYAKSAKIASMVLPEEAPIAIIPYFKRIKERSIVGKYDQYEWKKVPNFDYKFYFKRKGNVTVTAEKAVIDGIEVYRLVSDNDQFFQELYSNPETQFYESIILSRAGIFLLKHLVEQEGVKLDIVESNDHHTGMVLPIMKGEYSDTFKNTGHTMLLHNIAYQGQYTIDWFDEMGLPDYYRDFITRWTEINMMAVSARMLDPGNRAVTVSPRYVMETRDSYAKLGFLADKLLSKHPEYFVGKLNGLSENWNPATDKVLQAYHDLGFENFSYKNLGPKKNNKLALQKLFSKGAKNNFTKNAVGYLDVGSDSMLLASTNRLESQKQIDILEYQVLKAREEGLNIDFVVVGDGILENQMRALAEKISSDPESSVRFVYSTFDGDLEHLVLAAADGCLAPSDFEPGGLAHLKGMLYGAVPFVRWTGGLADTVEEHGDEQSGMGFGGVSRTFVDKKESNQVKGVLSLVHWDKFIDEVDKELQKYESQRGKFEATRLDLFEAIGRAFQVPGVLKLVNKEDKDRLFWESNGNPKSNGWAITDADTVRKAVNERQFFRAIKRGLDAYENQREYFMDVVRINAMKIEAYWSEKIESYFDFYQELKEAVTPKEALSINAEFKTGDYTGVKIRNNADFMKIQSRRDTNKITGLELLNKPSFKKDAPLDDKAMINEKAPGGVDFNMEKGVLDIRKNVVKYSLQKVFENLASPSFEGLTPVIIDFNPVTNLPQYVGLNR